MKKRYQVFVSSTFADLKEERKLVMQAVLERKCFPAGMELFPAMDKKQFDYIKQVIDDSDYYLLIIGVRYGSLDEDKVSFTEKEYDYAVAKGIPVIAFLPSDNSIINKVDVDESKQEKLKEFKEKVKSGRLVKFWDNAHDLKAKVISSLVDVFEDQPQIGWVRSNAVASGEAQKEIDRLQKEITRYQDDLKKLQDDLKEKEDNRQSLETSNQEAQKEIKSLQDTIKNLHDTIDSLDVELKKLKLSSDSKEVMSSVDRITVPGTSVAFNMVRVVGGTFMMGAKEDDKDALGSEKPAHQVTLSDYWIGETQVTQDLWEVVMGFNPSDHTGDLNLPVETVSWNDCQRFIEKLNDLTGKSFYLPTEAQWEFAACGGNKSKGYRYAGGNDIHEIAWFGDNSRRKTHPVGKLKPNEQGLYDMSGNVWEWCQDVYGFYRNDEQSNSTGSSYDSYHVVRGGCYINNARRCRVSYRDKCMRSSKAPGIGLRLAL